MLSQQPHSVMGELSKGSCLRPVRAAVQVMDAVIVAATAATAAAAVAVVHGSVGVGGIDVVVVNGVVAAAVVRTVLVSCSAMTVIATAVIAVTTHADVAVVATLPSTAAINTGIEAICQTEVQCPIKGIHQPNKNNPRRPHIRP